MYPKDLSFGFGVAHFQLKSDHFHRRYGVVVRTAPDEVSIAHEDAWQTIVGGQNPFPRNATFFKTPPGQPDNLVMTADPVANARMRQVVMPAFTERAVMKQEPVLKSYVDLLIEKLIDWFHWFAFDLSGQLCFGESFECLENARSHPWIRMIFSFIKMTVLAAITRYYAGLETLLMHFIPSSLRKKQTDHYAMGLERIHRRMASSHRDDFMAPMLENNPDFERMSVSEIESTMPIIVLAASETTATTLCGIVSALTRSTKQLHRLEHEIRGTFDKEEQITLRAVQNLPFLNAVISEGLRMYHPVAGGLLRSAPKGGATVCGCFLPEDTHVVVNSTAMSLSEDNFHRASEFLPERFLPADMQPAEFENDCRGSQKPFGFGARNCLGKSFALAEMRLVLARLVWKFDMSIAPGGHVEWGRLKTYVVVQKEPINVIIRER
ncbi:cytochrome P450 [Hypoxylon trugodes]|uniref:cytochrome P450 n=1 Tax=Hypoxylon trugodes TaxID=326681 RepID=UPI00218D0021|nr:cytochrome P450 [Hypoxylon trugodes]KAI1387309.1 cytochrome P450 [Hypoxylon trugodes]